ncbi:MAG TPA: penicillin-binding transpeptidase domain-containing protein [Vicinamibacteria bacterium]|nr:penicillin-binding transpeptidase domain-containing protein [Vicinamibacteria bacterium]
MLVAPPPSPRDRMVRLRLMLAALSACLWALVVMVRLVQLQVMGRPFFERQAARQSERTINLDPRRGAILDRNRHPLAVSVDAESVYAVPQDIEDPASTAAALGRALGLDAAARKELQVQLSRTRAFVWVRRKVDPGTARAVRDLQLQGVGFLTENRRYYPQRELAAHVIGYVGTDNTGMSGIEYALEDDMRGRAAKVVIRTDARRRALGHTEKPSTEGGTVVLTLDESIQHVAEKELDRAVEETGSIAGVAVVMDPRTGEILALANRPTFNPNRFNAYPSSRWRNRAVADAFEPGSIFKIVTAAAGLEEKVVDPDEVIDCGNGFLEVAGIRINDHRVFDHLTFRDVIARSSDVGVARVAQRLGRENFNRYIRAFGFGAATGVGLPGESGGLLRPPQRWSALSLPTLSFGQEIGVTALQMTAAVAAVANGGYLVKPVIVRQVEDSRGRVVRESRPEVVRRVIDPGTADALTDLLRGVVRSGTGARAAIPGYAVAGKTGTAQKIEPGGRYSMVDHVASFVGFVPASRPAIVVLVSLDTPRGAANQGGDVAAPLFARIAEPALRRLAVPPDDGFRVLRATAFRPEGIHLASYRPTTRADRPAAGIDGRPGGGAEPLPAEPNLMPDLRGASAREAATAAAGLGLIVELRGSGRVVLQTPAPGAETEAGMTCVLQLAGTAAPAAVEAPRRRRGATR